VQAAVLEVPLDLVERLGHLRARKRGRVVEGSGFENRRRATYQGFESLRFRRGLLVKIRRLFQWLGSTDQGIR
jgi:hypothetical protein